MASDLRQIGAYELQERLGRSNRSELWKAYDPQKQRNVAIKLILAQSRGNPDYPAYFAREVEAISSLHHPNIVQMYDARLLPTNDPDAMLAYLVTEYIEGQTLADYIHKLPRSGKVPPGPEIVQIFAFIGMAIDYAHQNGIIHGDLKPANVILRRSPDLSSRDIEPILTDTALTRLLSNNATKASTKRNLDALLYISPEQARGYPEGKYSDIYSLGVMLYEICTGVLPFQGNRPVALLMQHANATPPSPALINPNIHPALTSIIMRSLAKDPAGRFSSASAMTLALAESLNVRLPERLNYLAYSLANNAQAGLLDTPLPAISIPQLSNTAYGKKNHNAFIQDRQFSTDDTPAQILPVRSPSKRRQRIVFAALSVLLALTIVVSGLGIFSFLQGHSAPVKVVGHAFFLSSGQLNENINNQGINDELQLDLSGISSPGSGHSYYGWLLPDKNQDEAPPVFLGHLNVSNGSIHFLYSGGQNHLNLLATTSRFLITEEDASVTPTVPSPDLSTWRYYAELPQTPIPGVQPSVSMLDHFRHLLVESPELQAHSLRGGLAIWLLQNTQKVFAASTSARDAWQAKDFQTARSQIVRMIDYLDGKTLALKDLPPGVQLITDPHYDQIPLLGIDPKDPGYSNNEDTPPGFVYLIDIHLSGALQSPDTTQSQRKLAGQITADLNDVDQWLEQARNDAKQLLQLDDTQLAQPSALSVLNDMATQTQYAYAGRFDQPTAQSKGGAIGIYGNIQHLADFAVKPYTAS